MSDQKKNRREFLSRAFLTAAGAATLGPVFFIDLETATARTPGGDSMPVEDALLPEGGLLSGVPLDRPFSGSWFIEAIYGPVAGGLTLILKEGREGSPVRVDICLRGDEVKAPAFTKYLELFVMDGGGGVKRMPDSLMESLGDLASMLEDNEPDFRLLEGLMTFEERWESHPEFMARAACDLAPRAL